MFLNGYLNCLVFDDSEKLEAFLRLQTFNPGKQTYNFEPISFNNGDFSPENYHRVEDSFLRLRTEQVIQRNENPCKDGKTIFCILKKDYDRYRFIKEHSDNILLFKHDPQALRENCEMVIKFLKARGKPKLNMDLVWCLDSDRTFRLLG